MPSDFTFIILPGYYAAADVFCAAMRGDGAIRCAEKEDAMRSKTRAPRSERHALFFMRSEMTRARVLLPPAMMHRLICMVLCYCLLLMPIFAVARRCFHTMRADSLLVIAAAPLIEELLLR